MQKWIFGCIKILMMINNFCVGTLSFAVIQFWSDAQFVDSMVCCVVLWFVQLPVLFVLSCIYKQLCVCGISDRDDTDLTALVSSLVQLILDDHCRTVDGFQDLVDREWIALGHPWITRYDASSAEKVFLDWMPCMYSTVSANHRHCQRVCKGTGASPMASSPVPSMSGPVSTEMGDCVSVQFSVLDTYFGM